MIRVLLVDDHRLVRADLQVVVLTSFSDQDQVLDAVDAAAVGYLLKDADPADLLQGVRAAAGQSALDPKVARTSSPAVPPRPPRTSSATGNARP